MPHAPVQRTTKQTQCLFDERSDSISAALYLARCPAGDTRFSLQRVGRSFRVSQGRAAPEIDIGPFEESRGRQSPAFLQSGQMGMPGYGVKILGEKVTLSKRAAISLMTRSVSRSMPLFFAGIAENQIQRDADSGLAHICARLHRCPEYADAACSSMCKRTSGEADSVPKPIWLTPLAPSSADFFIGHAAKKIGGGLEGPLEFSPGIEETARDTDSAMNIHQKVRIDQRHSVDTMAAHQSRSLHPRRGRPRRR